MHVFVDVRQDYDYGGGNDRVSFIGQINGDSGKYQTSRFDSGYGGSDADWDGYNIPIHMLVPPGSEYEVRNLQADAPEVGTWFEVTL